jgi:XTP/dITP diphosphohydrolase
MPARQFSGENLIVASHNPGKVVEIADLLRPFRVKPISARELGLPEPVEDGDSFIANAEIKALAAATKSGLPALADDSGLCVNALDGDPGIYSARWAGPQKDFMVAMEAVEKALTGKPDRRAYFFAALCLAWPDGHRESFEGRVDGTLVWPPKGCKGFGYDPVFQPDGFDITFGEMEPTKKHRMSHRARAFEKLIDACFATR